MNKNAYVRKLIGIVFVCFLLPLALIRSPFDPVFLVTGEEQAMSYLFGLVFCIPAVSATAISSSYGKGLSPLLWIIRVIALLLLFLLLVFVMSAVLLAALRTVLSFTVTQSICAVMLSVLSIIAAGVFCALLHRECC